MAEENLWTKLSFDVDLQKGEAKEVEAPEVEQEAPDGDGETQEIQQDSVEQSEAEDKKRPSRTERLKRQRDKALQEAEMLRIALAQAQHGEKKASETLDTSMRQQVEITKKALEDKKKAAQQSYLSAFEQGDKEALLQAQNSLVEVEVDLRDLARAAPPKAEKEEPVEAPSSGQNTPVVPAQRGPSAKVKSWIAENPWFEEDEEMRGAALGIHTKLVRDGIEPESDEYFEAIEKRMKRLFPENFDKREEEEDEPAPKAKRKAPPVSGSGQNKGAKGTVRLRVTEEDEKSARRMGVPLDVYMLNKAEIEASGFDPNKRENSYVKIF